MSAVVAAPEESGSLVYPNERRLFAITLAISVVVWLVILVGTFGIALIYVLLAFLFYLFVQSAFISYLRGHAAQITAGQFADLHDRIRGACMKLGVDPMPDAFLLHGNGAFNAFATRFLGRTTSCCCRTWWTRWNRSGGRSTFISGTSWGISGASICCGGRCWPKTSTSTSGFLPGACVSFVA